MTYYGREYNHLKERTIHPVPGGKMAHEEMVAEKAARIEVYRRYVEKGKPIKFFRPCDRISETMKTREAESEAYTIASQNAIEGESEEDEED